MPEHVRWTDLGTEAPSRSSKTSTFSIFATFEGEDGKTVLVYAQKVFFFVPL